MPHIFVRYGWWYVASARTTKGRYWYAGPFADFARAVRVAKDVHENGWSFRGPPP